MSSAAGRAEAAVPPAVVRRKLVDAVGGGEGDRGQEQLGDPVAGLDPVRLAPEVDEDDNELPSVAGVDQPWCVGHRDARPEREAGARDDEAGEAVRDLDRQPGWDR